MTRRHSSNNINSIRIVRFTGVYHQGNIGVDIGIGFNIGFGVSPVYGLDTNYQYGTTGTNGPFKNN